MSPDLPSPPAVVTLSPAQWDAFLAGLYERDERLDLRAPGQEVRRDEAVDAYALSAHAEALRSPEVDGDLWGTLEDLDETAEDEEAAWAKIVAFYLERDCVLVRVSGTEAAEGEDAEPEEWIFSRALATRLGLLGAASGGGAPLNPR